MTNPDEIMEAGTRLADGLVAIYSLNGPASTIRQLVRALGQERERADALERIINDPEAIPRRIGRLTDAVEALREAIPPTSPTPEPSESSKANPTVHLPTIIASEFAVSRSEARRSIAQGAVRVDDRVIECLDMPASELAGRTVYLGSKRARFLSADLVGVKPNDPNPERAPTVETRYGTLPAGTRFGQGDGDGLQYVWLLGEAGWRVDDHTGDRLPTGYAFGSGEIIPPLAHDSLGYPLYEGDRVEWTGRGSAGGTVKITQTRGIAGWLVRSPCEGRSLRKIHDEPAS